MEEKGNKESKKSRGIGHVIQRGGCSRQSSARLKI
jgi:hypothetical protein